MRAGVIVAFWTLLVLGYIVSQSAQGLERYCQALDCPRVSLPMVRR